MIGFEEQKRIFELIGNTLRKRVECLVIGGSAMLFYNFSKIATKDVDMVFASERERDFMIEALDKLGFKKNVYEKGTGKPVRMEFKDMMFDLFAGEVFRFKISGGISGRVKEMVEFSNLVAKIISPEDIIILKSMTDRKGDRDDASRIIKETNVNWDVILQEIEWQSKNNPNAAILFYDFLEDLVHDFNADIPRDVIKKVKEMYKGMMDRLR